MSRIISIGTAVPPYGTKQHEILHFMQEAYGNNEATCRKLNVLFHHSGINSRYSAISDFDNSIPTHTLFNGSPILPNVKERLDVFGERAIPLALKAIHSAVEKLETTVDDFKFTHLITVSCTGLYAPGIDAVLTERLDLPNDIFRTSINFLGCNAAFHALRIGDLITRTDANARVLIVCVELCTLHFQPKDNNDNLLSNTIFGDGAAAVVVTSDAFCDEHRQSGLAINGFYSQLLHQGKSLMGWNITPVNFEMILNANVPDFIGGEIIDIVAKAANHYQILPTNIDLWAIHPGGKKILDVIRNTLQLSDNDLQSSYKILNQYGNMSSPTVLFVLDDMEKNLMQPGETILSVGFGPGLSIETGLFTYVG